MLCLDEQFLLFEDARWKKNRQKKKFRSAARNSEKATFRAPHFQSSARRIDIHFVSLIFFDPPDGPLRKKGFARSLYYGCVCVFLNSMMHYLVSRSKRTLPVV